MQYSDYQYLASLIRALGHTQRPDDMGKILKQVMRYISVEKLMPSHQNVILVACLQVHTSITHSYSCSCSRSLALLPLRQLF